MSPISAQTTSFFEQNGYCVVKDVISQDECRRYLAESEKLAQLQPVKYEPIMNPDRTVAVFRELLAQKTVVAGLEALLRSKVWGLQSMLYYKKPGSLGRDLHQDNHYAQAGYGAYIGTWLPFEDTDKENGGLLVYPGSHVEPVLEVVVEKDRQQTNVGGFKNDRGSACKVPAKYTKTYLDVPGGACVFIHGNVVHGSEENHSGTRFRRVFAGHYIKQGAKFIAGTHAKRMPIDLYGQ